MWDYVFFVDVEGHGEDPELGQALDELDAASNLMKVLGSYPRAVL
jgi:chorismate mutase/prephenate dehydratase